MNLRDWRVFVPLIMAGYIVARFLGVAFHEIVGHDLAASLLGGTCYAVFVSPSAGFTYLFIPPGTSAPADAVVNLAGIAVEIAAGTLLLFLYRRFIDPLSRLMALLFLQVLLFQAFMYMAIGAFPETGGDTSQVVKEFDSNALLAVFVIIGIGLGVLVAYVVTRELLSLLAPTLEPRKWILIAIAFWLFPVVVDIALEGVSGVPPWPFFVAAIVVAVVAGYFIGMRYRQYVAELSPTPVRPLGVAKRDIMALGIVFLVISATWLAAFGPSTASAHGVMIGEPPLEAEEQWLGSFAINLHVRLARTGNASDPLNMSVEFKMRSIPFLESPLDRQIWSTFDDRAYFPFYENVAFFLANSTFNSSGWSIESEEIDGAAWAQGQTYENARVISLSMNASERQRLLRVSGDSVTVVMHDPYRYPSPAAFEGYTDEVIVGWGAGLSLVGHSQHGGTTIPDTITGELRWQNISYESAPDTYSVTIHLD